MNEQNNLNPNPTPNPMNNTQGPQPNPGIQSQVPPSNEGLSNLNSPMNSSMESQPKPIDQLNQMNQFTPDNQVNPNFNQGMNNPTPSPLNSLNNQNESSLNDDPFSQTVSVDAQNSLNMMGTPNMANENPNSLNNMNNGNNFNMNQPSMTSSNDPNGMNSMNNMNNVNNMNGMNNMNNMNSMNNSNDNMGMPNNGVFKPSTPLGGSNDISNVGFMPASGDIPKKKNKLIPVLIILIFLCAIGGIGYFVVYPYVMKTYFSDPKNVYETTIKNAFKGINTTATDLVHSKAIYEIEGTLDSNVEYLKDYSGYTYGLNVGIDPTKKNIQSGLYIKDNNQNIEYSYYSYLKDNKYYDRYSNNRNYLYLGEGANKSINSLAAMLNDESLFNTTSNLNDEDVNYVINKVSSLLVESIDEDKLSQEDAAINLNGETLKVTDNKYVMDHETIKKMFNHVRDGLINDDKTLDILSKMTEISKEDIKNTLKDIDENQIESPEYVLTTSIYTYGNKNEIIGFAFHDQEEKCNFYYYKKGDYGEGKLTYVYDDATTNTTATTVFKLVSTKSGDTTKINVAYDDEDITDMKKATEILALDIRSWTDSLIDFDYKVTIQEESINGSYKQVSDVNNERAKYSFDVELKSGSEFIKVSLKISEDWSSEIANINTDTAITVSDAELATIQQDFITSISNLPIAKLFTTVDNNYDPSIGDYYENNGSLNDFNNNEFNTDTGNM